MTKLVSVQLVGIFKRLATEGALESLLLGMGKHMGFHITLLTKAFPAFWAREDIFTFRVEQLRVRNKTWFGC